MKINNNFNNNKQVGFKANLISIDGVSEKLALRLAKIAEEAKGTEGDTVLLKQSIRSNGFNNAISHYDTKFEYFKKGSIFKNDKSSVFFTTTDHQRFGMWDGNLLRYNASGFDVEERDNKIVGFFQNFMDSMSKK